MYKRQVWSVEPITRSQSLYSLEKHGIYNIVSQDDYDNTQEPYEAEVDEVLGLTSVIKTEKEETFASLFSATNVSQGKTLAPTEKFNESTSDIRGEVTTGRKTVREGCGISPNTSIIPENVIDVILGNDQLKDWYRSGTSPRAGGGLISYTEIAKFMQVSRLFVPNSSKTTDGVAISQIWDNDIQLMVAPPTAIKRQVCFAYRLLRRGTGRGGASAGGGLVVYKNRPINPPVGTNIFVEDDYAYLIANAKAAYVLRGTI